MDKNELKKAHTAKLLLDTISPTFCTVKWKHATINLGSGAVKSCCHLPFRKVEIENSVKGMQLHDTASDRAERKSMLNGQYPTDCSYCWRVENQGHVSDRINWSAKTWMSPFTADIAKLETHEAQNPSWLELNFSNLCNLKCTYCSPIFSSRWLGEINEFGPYPTEPRHNDINYLQGVQLNEKFDNTLLMQQFWPWFEKVYAEVKLLKITGGEPFLNSHTFEVLKSVIERPNRAMNLSINSNLSVPAEPWNKFIELISQILKDNSVKRFHLQPSIDCFGTRAEYIRHGLDFALFQSRVNDYLERSNGNIIFICTLNNLALGSLQELWAYILELKQKYGPRGQWISMTSEVLMSPGWQNINLLPENFQSYLQRTIEFALKNKGDCIDQFSDFEIQGLYRAVDMMKTQPSDAINTKKNFYLFFQEHDRRRQTDLVKTFPEINDFWDECKSLVQR